ncbi:MAG: hypothetical protein CK426_03685 [Legionella sp.]|nr:MAG: hypothetical protein CK423_05755 [Legionella sp.]PJD99117.1 MAG: hypothetical protein CK426_03685 [Legionella sp.]
MNKLTHFIVVASAFLSAQLSFSDSLDWKPKQSFYLTAGYSLTHEMYRAQWTTINEVSPAVTYNPTQVYPNNLSGLRFGFGSKLGNADSQFGYEFDFNQVFAKTRTTQGLQVTRPEKIILGFVDYMVNPESRLQWFLAAGGVITNVPLTVKTIAPNQLSSSTSTSTSADPAVAAFFLYPLNSSLALKGIFIWKIAPYDTAITGTLIPLLMLNYYP